MRLRRATCPKIQITLHRPNNNNLLFTGKLSHQRDFQKGPVDKCDYIHDNLSKNKI